MFILQRGVFGKTATAYSVWGFGDSTSLRARCEVECQRCLVLVFKLGFRPACTQGRSECRVQRLDLCAGAALLAWAESTTNAKKDAGGFLTSTR